MTLKNKDFCESQIRQLGRLRAWFEGYESGGGNVPNCTDALRWAQILIEEALDKKLANNK